MATNKHISIGRLGEDVAVKYLENRGFCTIERNYSEKWGEIDIIMEKDDVLHFVEVKAGAIRGEFPKEGTEVYRPEDHMHAQKLERLSRIIQTYLIDKQISDDAEWTIDLVVVLINEESGRARVRVLRGILLT